jgi:transposase
MLELIIPKSIATPGLLAYILTTKFAVLKSSVTNIDQTTVQVLKEPKKSNSYMWVLKGGPSDKPVILFQYHSTRSGDVAAVFLRGYKGIVQTDGYGGYNFLDDKKDILHVSFWIHAHRKFKEVTKAAKFIRKCRYRPKIYRQVI